MVKWDNLYEYERNIYLERAKSYLQNGLYEGFDVKELAIFLYTNKNNEVSNGQ